MWSHLRAPSKLNSYITTYPAYCYHAHFCIHPHGIDNQPHRLYHHQKKPHPQYIQPPRYPSPYIVTDLHNTSPTPTQHTACFHSPCLLNVITTPRVFNSQPVNPSPHPPIVTNPPVVSGCLALCQAGLGKKVNMNVLE